MSRAIFSRGSRAVFMALFVVFGLASLLLNGCGGGGGGQSGTAPTPQVAQATITVNWPVRPKASQMAPRLVPLAANSITITIMQGTNPIASHTLTRPNGDQAGTSAYTFGDPSAPAGSAYNGLPVGALTATATAYPNADGTGTAQATGFISFVTALGTNVPITIDMGSTIDHLAVTPANPSIAVGVTLALSATARDVYGAMVLTVASKTQWSSSDPAIARVDTNSGVVTGVAEGTTNLTVTDSESGKTGTTGVIVTASGGGAVAYTVTDLGTLPGGNLSYASAINNAGQVVGNSYKGHGTSQAFLYSNGQMQGLGTLPGNTDSFATGINSAGQVVGNVGISSLGALQNISQAFLYSNGTMQGLGTLNGASGINDAGQVVGSANTSAHAFLYSNGRMQDLGTLPGGTSSGASGINNAGQVVGSADIAGGNTHAFLYSSGQMQDLGTLPGDTDSFATGINSAGQMVGKGVITGGAHAFLYSNGKMQDLGTLPGGTSSEASGINDAGQVVGDANADSSAYSYVAFLYSSGRMQDLNTLIPANSGWLLTKATGINASGQICGDGYVNSRPHAFLLTPAAVTAHQRL